MDYDALYDLFTEEQLDGYDGEFRFDLKFSSIYVYEGEKTYPHFHHYIARIWEVESKEEGRTIYIFECGDLACDSVWEQMAFDYRYTMLDALEKTIEIFNDWYRTFKKADLELDFHSEEGFKEFESVLFAKL